MKCPPLGLVFCLAKACQLLNEPVTLGEIRSRSKLAFSSQIKKAWGQKLEGYVVMNAATTHNDVMFCQAKIIKKTKKTATSVTSRTFLKREKKPHSHALFGGLRVAVADNYPELLTEATVPKLAARSLQMTAVVSKSKSSQDETMKKTQPCFFHGKEVFNECLMRKPLVFCIFDFRFFTSESGD